MIINKKKLIEMVQARVNKARGVEQKPLTRQDVYEVYQTIFDTITEAMAAGLAVQIAGFGEFMGKLTKGRSYSHPNNRSLKTALPDRLLPKFKPFTALKKTVLGKDNDAAS